MNSNETSDIIARLVECGLEAKRAQIVMDLATHPPSKASEVGKRIGISRMDAYNSLRKMQEWGLVKATLDKPMRFQGIRIEEVFALLIQRSEMDLRRMQEHLDAMKEGKQSALLSYNAPQAEANFSVLKDRHSIMANLQSILNEAESNVWMLLGNWGILHLKRSGAYEALINAVNRGVKVRISSSLNEKTIKFFDEIDERIEIRHHEHFTIQGIYVDDELGLQFINTDENPTGRGKSDTALLIESKGFIEAHAELMDIQWAAAISYRAARARLMEGSIIEPLNLTLGEGSYYERLKNSLQENLEKTDSSDAPNAFLRKAGESIPSNGSPQVAALSSLGIDLNEVLSAVGRRIGQELAGKWNGVESDVEFWKHLGNEWNQMGMGQIVTKGMPPSSVLVHNGAACGGKPLVGGMFCHLDEGILQGIVMERHNIKVMSKERVCTSEGLDTCHFEIECQSTPTESVV